MTEARQIPMPESFMNNIWKHCSYASIKLTGSFLGIFLGIFCNDIGTKPESKIGAKASFLRHFSDHQTQLKLWLLILCVLPIKLLLFFKVFD